MVCVWHWVTGGGVPGVSEGEVHQQEFIPMCHISEDQNYLYMHLFDCVY